MRREFGVIRLWWAEKKCGCMRDAGHTAGKCYGATWRHDDRERNEVVDMET
jgi:hypothetical protein